MEEVLDLLMSFVDFQAFKELMLAHKAESTTSCIHVSFHRHPCFTLDLQSPCHATEHL